MAHFATQLKTINMPLYRNKPVVIEAWPAIELIQAATNDWSALPKPVAVAYELGGWVFSDRNISIPTLEGTMMALDTDMIICGVNGEFYPCKADIFAKTYERA